MYPVEENTYARTTCAFRTPAYGVPWQIGGVPPRSSKRASKREARCLRLPTAFITKEPALMSYNALTYFSFTVTFAPTGGA